MAKSTIPNDLPLIPLKDLILIKQLEVEEKTPGGLYRPTISSKMEHQGRGLVLACGKGWYLPNGDLILPEVEPGDEILYVKMQTNEYRDGLGGVFYLLPQANILAKFPKKGDKK